MSIALEQGDQSSAIRLEGAIDIASAAELKERLVQALKAGHEEGTDVRVSIAGVEYLDVTAYQLLWAAEREARALKVKFSFFGEAPDTAWVGLADAGLERFKATENDL